MTKGGRSIGLIRKLSLCLLAIFGGILFIETTLLGYAYAGPSERLVITGTGSSVRVMQLVAEAFQKKHPTVIVEVLPSIGSTGGIKAVIEGRIDIGLSSRPLKQEEKNQGVVEEAYGRAAFIFGTQDSNQNKGFSLSEIEEIYGGKRTTWREGTPIRLILRPVSDSYSAYLGGITPGLKAASEKAHSIPGVFVGVTDQDAVAQMEKTPGSFGVTSSCIVAAEKRKIRALPVDGVAPTLANVSSGRYSYAMTMSLVYQRDTRKRDVKDFVDFLFSGPGQKLISRTGHVPLRRKTGT